MKRNWYSKWLALVTAAAAVFALYFGVARPWYLRWGATDSEVAQTLPGDDRVPGAPERTTRAVTIQAPTDQVWAWVAQLGQDRAGFYSFEILEDLVGCEMPGATRILPERQEWKPGDRLWMYPPDKLHGLGGAPLVAYRPGRHMVFATRQIGTPSTAPENGTWSFYLEPIGPHTTRLIVRGLSAGVGGPVANAWHRMVFEPAHYVMERRMMLNIRALAEGRRTSKAEENVAVALWTLTVLILLVSLAEFFRRHQWERPLAVAVAAAILYQILTLTQPPSAVGVAMVAALALGLLRPAGERGTEHPAPRSRRKVNQLFAT